MIDARFVPLEKWPGKERTASQRKAAPFRASYAKTLDLLESELNHLRAKDVTIQAYFSRQDIRNDGWPKSSARPSSPGVIVGFTQWNSHFDRAADKWVRVAEEMSFPCDRFNSWEDNLRAIALAFEALRKVDRYGITQSGEQYKGWKRLPEPAPPDQMTREEAALYIAGFSAFPKDYIFESQTNLESAYRKAASVLHPDIPGGSHDAFVRLQKAKEVLSRRESC